jgi:general stress protein 26
MNTSDAAFQPEPFDAAPAREPHAVSSRNTRGSLAELQKLLHDFDTAMFTTITAEGLLHARPMAIQKEVPELPCDFWFVASIDSVKMAELAREPRVGVSCLRGRGSAYLSVSARAVVRQDKALVRKLWQPDWKVWWPQGPDDPLIAFILLQVERAEYFEPAGGAVRVLYEMVKSLVKGESGDKHLPPPKHL